MTLVKIILWASIGWLPVLIYITQKNEAKFKKNIVVGATLPPEAQKDPQVLSLLESYKKQNAAVCTIVGIFIIPCLFAKSFNWIYLLWAIWLDAVIIATPLPFITTNKKLRDLKKVRGWMKKNEDTENTVTVDLSAVSTPKWRSPWLFAFAFALSLLPIAVNPDIWYLPAIIALTQICFFLCYRYCFRTQSDRIDDNLKLTLALTNVRRRYWGRFWLVCAFATSAYSFSTLLITNSQGGFLFLTFVYTVAIAVLAIMPELKVRRIQEELTQKNVSDNYLDSDEYWIWGMFYHNSNDRHGIVNARVGMGTTVNLARPIGKFLVIIAILCLAIVPVLPFWINSTVKSEVLFQMSENTVEITCGKDEWTVDPGDAISVELLKDYPEDLSRIWGTATDTILKGTFSARGIPTMQVCLNPEKTPYILVQTSQNKYYLFGTDTREETLELYKMLGGK